MLVRADPRTDNVAHLKGNNMARFYGTIKGQRGEATRLGHTSLCVTAQSYSGDVCVSLRKGLKNENENPDDDYVHIYSRGHGDGFSCTLFDGKVADLLKFNLDALVHSHVMKVFENNGGVLPAVA
jgi:hypothetical protein